MSALPHVCNYIYLSPAYCCDTIAKHYCNIGVFYHTRRLKFHFEKHVYAHRHVLYMWTIGNWFLVRICSPNRGWNSLNACEA